MEQLNKFEAMVLDLFWEAKKQNFENAQGLCLKFDRDGAPDSFNLGIFPALPNVDVFKTWALPDGVAQEKEKGIVDMFTFAEAMLADVDVLTPRGLAAIIQEFGDLRKEGLFNVGVNNNAYYIHDDHLGMVFWLSSKSPACVMGEFSSVEELKFH